MLKFCQSVEDLPYPVQIRRGGENLVGGVEFAKGGLEFAKGGFENNPFAFV